MIVVFGSNVLDLFFEQENLPPKDQALFLDSHIEAPGGKGANQAIAAARAGSNVRFYGALGEGGHGRQMYKNLAQNGIDVSGIEFLDMPSGLATIFVDDNDGTHRIVVSQGANLKAKQDTIPDKHLKKETVVLVQGELPILETEDLIARAKAKGAKTVMNFAPAKQALSEQYLLNLDIIILNTHEADLLAKNIGMDASDKEQFASDLYDRFNLITIVTLGPGGCLMSSEKGIYRVPSLRIKPIDTVGAGDAHAGYFCAALDQGHDMETALKWASIAGSLACTSIGAQAALPVKEDVISKQDEIQITMRPRNSASSASNVA
ncbi:MAG: ribokinase [Pseudomonadota bacterium]